MPGYYAQICAQALTKGYVQTSASARAPCLGTRSDCGLHVREGRGEEKTMQNCLTSGKLMAMCIFHTLCINVTSNTMNECYNIQRQSFCTNHTM